jgi:dTDP-glucose pyrophosphorylase
MKKIQIVIPSAGRGSRFIGSVWKEPKPMISWDGKSMVEHVIDNFRSENSDIVVVKKREHPDPSVRCVNVDYVTDGPATTAYLAKELLDPELELIITNCDQIIKDWDESRFLSHARKYEAALGCFISTSEKNSYVKLDQDGYVSLVKEKEVISNIATNGVHYWKKAKYFFDSYDRMRADGETYKGEYYIAPSYNYLINDGFKIGVFLFNEHYPIGTPDDLDLYLNSINV